MSLSERVREEVGTEDNRGDVINAFNDVYRKLRARTTPFRMYWESYDRSAYHWNNYSQEMTLLSDFYIVHHGVLAVGGNEFGIPDDLEDYTFPVEVPGQFSIREGIPVEGLLYLIDLEPSGTERRRRERELLFSNSAIFLDRHNYGDEFFWQRRALEAFIISNNPLRANWTSNLQHAMDNNWTQAGRALGRRRELVVPPL